MLLMICLLMITAMNPDMKNINLTRLPLNNIEKGVLPNG